MTTKIGINGFGRIGRLTLRSIIESGREDVEVVLINSRGSVESMAHLFKYDSIFGTFSGTVGYDENFIRINDRPFEYRQNSNISDNDWSDVDVVMECSGKLKNRKSVSVHLECGAPYVLVAYPCEGADTTVVYGVNEDTVNKSTRIVSNASCTTNCLAIPLRLLEDNFGIVNGYMTTVHAYTGDQNLVDASHSDLRRARAAGCSIIPTSTGAGRNIGLIIPELKGKLDGTAMRVPVANVSCVDLTVNLKRKTDVASVNEVMRQASESFFSSILAVSSAPLVSSDFIGNSASAIFDNTQTQVIGGKLLRILAWYDNEWGFSCRMADVASYIGSRFL